MRPARAHIHALAHAHRPCPSMSPWSCETALVIGTSGLSSARGAGNRTIGGNTWNSRHWRMAHWHTGTRSRRARGMSPTSLASRAPLARSAHCSLLTDHALPVAAPGMPRGVQRSPVAGADHTRGAGASGWLTPHRSSPFRGAAQSVCVAAPLYRCTFPVSPSHATHRRFVHRATAPLDPLAPGPLLAVSSLIILPSSIPSLPFD